MKVLNLVIISLLALFSNFLEGGQAGGGNANKLVLESRIYSDLETRISLRESVGSEPRARILGSDIFAQKLETEIRTVDEDKLVVPRSHERPQDVKAMVNLRNKIDQLKAM